MEGHFTKENIIECLFELNISTNKKNQLAFKFYKDQLFAYNHLTTIAVSNTAISVTTATAARHGIKILLVI